MTQKILTAGFALLHFFSYSQVDPEVTGDTMLCPEGTGMLTTGTFDTYQWHQRYFMTEDTFVITGATSQTLEMNYYDFAGSYVMVEVTQNGVTGFSEEIFVDGYVFASPTVSISGEFGTGPNGEVLLCVNDTVTLEFNPPYTESVTWYNDGNAIAGENDSVLVVTSAGNYTVSGSPEQCPDFENGMYIPIEVVMENCGLGLNEEVPAASVYPNPAKEFITVLAVQQPTGDFVLVDQSGRKVKTIPAAGLQTEIGLQGMNPGIYFIEAQFEKGKQVMRFVIE